MRYWLAVAGLMLVLNGCSGPRFVGRPDLTIVQNSTLPPPTRADLSSQERAFVIGPLDQLAVDVFGLAELSRSVQVDASGQIFLPLAGGLPAAGRTPEELAGQIAARLRERHVRDPQVTVSIAQATSQSVTVDGAVDEPGIYPIVGRMTLMRAIARAKGVTEFAATNLVVVFRTVDHQRMAALYDLRAIRAGAYEDPEVYANDVVVVSESEARRLFNQILTASGAITAPLVAILRP
jgi:polysaccharide export outer membrane protein